MKLTLQSLRARLFPVLIGLAFASLACGPIEVAREILSRLPTPTVTPGFEAHSSDIWYVATDGDDSNECATPEEACRTLNEVLSRATDDDIINIGPGTFTEPTRGPVYAINDLNLTIRGAGQAATILESDGTRTVLFLHGDSRVTISDLTLQNGGGDAPGYCLSLRGTSSATVRNVTIQNCANGGVEHMSGQLLHLIDVTVQRSQAPPGLGAGDGGSGVVSYGNITIEGGQVIDNASTGINILGDYGPANITGTLVARNGLEGIVLSGVGTLREVRIEGNDIDPSIGAHHSGLRLGADAEVTVINSQIRGNDNGVDLLAGAVLNMQDSLIEEHPRTGLIIPEGAEAVLQRVTIRENGSLYAGTSILAGIGNQGRLTVQESTIANNHNGGLGNLEPSADLSLIDSTVRDNEGNLASVYNLHGTALIEGSTITGDNNTEGAISNRGTMTIRNSTISGNRGVGIEAGAGTALSISYTTITDNDEIGLNAHRGGEVITLISNSLIVGNGGRSDCLFGSGFTAPSTSGKNIDSDGSCGFDRTASMSEIALGPLADNGGPTQTHALMDGSIAIDAASGDCLPTDQRGTARPQGLNCDVGAYEASAPPLSIAPPLVTVTPDFFGGRPLVLEDTFCWKGPGSPYDVVSSLLAGTQVDLRGVGRGGGWLVVNGPRYPDVDCWMPEEKLQLDPDLDLTALPVFDIPPLPTPTPTFTPEPPPPTACTPPPNGCPVFYVGNQPIQYVWNSQTCTCEAP